MYINRFIVVEGIDGSGKSSAVKYLGDKLTEMNVPHLLVRSYPNDEHSEYLRDLWIQQKVGPECVLQIVLALRAKVLHDQIIPALKEGKVVISDRWHDTTFAYQSFGQHLGSAFVTASMDQHFTYNNRINSALVGHDDIREMIDHYATIYLGVTQETSRQRVGVRGDTRDAFEKENNAFFERVIMGYNSRMVERETNRTGYRGSSKHSTHVRYSTGMIWKIDANQDLEYVQDRLDKVMINNQYLKP